MAKISSPLMAARCLLLLLWVVLTVLLLLSSDVVASRPTGCLNEERSLPWRKRNNMELFKRFSIAVGEGKTAVSSSEQLRWVPSGPDPLHHNGSPPKKPQTP